LYEKFEEEFCPVCQFQGEYHGKQFRIRNSEKTEIQISQRIVEGMSKEGKNTKKRVETEEKKKQ